MNLAIDIDFENRRRGMVMEAIHFVKFRIEWVLIEDNWLRSICCWALSIETDDKGWRAAVIDGGQNENWSQSVDNPISNIRMYTFIKLWLNSSDSAGVNCSSLRIRSQGNGVTQVIDISLNVRWGKRCFYLY